jgi:hypothetical protein
VLHFSRPGIGHERNAICALHHEAPRGCVDHLPRDREHLEPDRQPTLTSKIERQEIEEQRAIVARFERHQAAARLRIGGLMQRLEVRRLSTQRRAVVDEFYRELTGTEVQLHNRSR